MLIDYLSVAIGAGAVFLLLIILQIIKHFKARNYILPELKNHVTEAHKNLLEANTHLQKLHRAFMDIEKENA